MFPQFYKRPDQFTMYVCILYIDKLCLIIIYNYLMTMGLIKNWK